MMKKTSQGRQKLAMVKIPKKSNLQVTFSKRRSGVFKKASELCTLCGVEIAMVVFSPANKPFSFGHPNFDSVATRFFTEKSPMRYSEKFQLVEAQTRYSSNSSPIVEELNVNLGDINRQLEGERKRGKSLDEMRKNGNRWWESPVDELSLKELELLKASLEELKNNVALTKQAYSVLTDVPFGTNISSDSLIVGNFASGFPNVNFNFGFGNGVF